MFKFLVVSLPLFWELVVYAVYGSEYSDKIFYGIPLAMPRFRDLYILILNVRCPTPVYLFNKLGSCSDSFYGLSPGQFDYPQLPFYLFNHIPQFISSRPNLAGLLLGTLFLLSFILLSSSLQKEYRLNPSLATLTYGASIYSFPFRYLIERGQLDQLAWALAFLSIVLISSNNSQINKKFIFLLSLILLSLSAILKAFTLPFLGLLTIIILLNKGTCFYRFSALIVSLITAAMLLANPTSPGSIATLLQVEQGTVFGFSLGLSAPSSNLTHVLLKLAIITLAFIAGILSLKITSRETFSIVNLTGTLGASTFLAFYFLTTSANYKLIPLALILLWIVYARSLKSPKEANSRSIGAANIEIASLAPILAIVWCGYYNYRPYIPALQFLTVDFTDYVVIPYLCGTSLSILFLVLFRLDLRGVAKSH